MPDTSPNENTPLETTGRTIARITPAKVPAGTASTGHGEDRDPGSRKNSAIEDPRSIIRQGLAVILLFFGVLGAWAYWGEISGAVVAPGKIKVESERKTVQHLEGGIVDTILVREGQDVAEGQVLVELESVQVMPRRTCCKNSWWPSGPRTPVPWPKNLSATSWSGPMAWWNWPAR